jgi:4-oxalomesaconate tautomerase
VFAAITAVTAIMSPDAVGHHLTEIWPQHSRLIDVEHPSGHLLVKVDFDPDVDSPQIHAAGVVRTARKLFAGKVFPRA